MGKTIPRTKNIMSQSTYQSVVLAQRPKSLIVPGETFTLKTNPILTEKDVKDGQVLVETLYLSLDPAMRGWLNGMNVEHDYAPVIERCVLVCADGTHRCKILYSTGADRGSDARNRHWESLSVQSFINPARHGCDLLCWLARTVCR